ncbi:PEP-CTERM sorting domain-containing protein [Luteolibacter sp. AS25]|uniref:PEP-CTERM sorting domain-containing protein n=1 Tax=Luteolibacter sp. AS25 TaxID=3135776 RepID=UPI00398AE16C
MKKTLFNTLGACTLMAGSAHAALVYSEDFTSLVLQTQSASTTDPVVTATTSGGTWSAGTGTTIVGTELAFTRPDTTGGWSASTIVLASSLFTEGAGSYALTFDYSAQTNVQSRLFAGVYDVDYSTGSLDSLNQVAGGWNRAFPTGTVTVSGGATASLLTSGIYDSLATGITQNFEYDGSGDILLVFGGGRSSNNFGQSRLDNVAVNSIPEVSSTALFGLGFAGLLLRRRRCS